MKNILFLFVLLSCSLGFTESGYAQNKDRLENLEKTINFLASNDLMGREIGSKGIENAAQFIEQKFKKADLKPYFKTYRDSFEYRNLTGYNIVAFKEGTDPNLKDELVIFGAHYDHIGILEPKKNDSIANGANDDASGTAMVLELANYFADKETKRSLLFVLFSGEEVGLIGSQHLAKRLKEENTKAYIMLNFEMIGVPRNNSDQAYLTGYKHSNLAKIFNSFAGEKVLTQWEGAEKYQLFKRSDNYSFFNYLKIPAHTISTFDFKNFNQYHKVGDEVDLLDFQFMEHFLSKSIPAIEKIVNSGSKDIKLNN